nr:LOW QUALITY PROTEIN: E3 ubiquitin-protein ligase UBR2-like [Lepeophtheirus salmonis]
MDSKMDEDHKWVYYDDSVHLTDFWNGLINSGHPDNPLEEWKCFSRSSSPEKDLHLLSNPFFDYWRIQVPRLLSPNRGKNCLNQTFDEEEIAKLLIQPLEAFIADSYDNTKEFFEELSQYDCPPSACGHTFLRTEPTYSCRDCGYDQTCVLCNSCFENSIHKNHRYRVNTSNGEGYCDCGDEEAFKEGAICDIHLKYKEKEISHKEVLEKIPIDFRNRTKELFRQIFFYIFKAAQCRVKDNDFSVGVKEKQTWPELEYVFKYSNYCVVLLNDNAHSYNYVTKAIRENLGPGCSNKMASDITAYVDKHGRGILKVGNYRECVALCSRFDSKFNALSEFEQNVRCRVLPTCMIAHQNFITRLLHWLNETLIPKCIVFRAILSEVIFSTDKPLNLILSKGRKCDSICNAILVSDTDVWKEIRALWKNLISSGIMMDFESKKTLAKIYSKNYSEIMESFVADNQEIEHSITTLSIQIYAVPSLVQQLLEEDNIFYKIIQCFYDQMKNYIDIGSNGKDELNLQFWQGDDMSAFERSQNIPTDLSLILGLLPPKISEKTRQNFLAGMEILTECLVHIQGLNPLTRQVHSHTEFENLDLERPYKITAFFTEIMDHISKWCKQDKGILVGVVNILLEKCFRNEDGDNYIVKKCVSPFSRENICLVSKVKQRIENKGTLIHLINPVLNSIVMLSQIHAGMWKRNGSAAEVLTYIYCFHGHFNALKKDDLIIVQLAASLASDPGLIIMSLMQRFRAVSWANGDLDKIEKKCPDFYEKNNDLIDEFLSFILAIVCERQIISSTIESDELKFRIIQLMCIGPMKHSSIINLIGCDKDIDSIIKNVADIKKDGSKMLYHIKEEFLSSYNPFYFFYSKEQRSKAMENISKLHKKNNKYSFCPPPVLPPFPPLFEGLRYVLRSLPIINMLKVNFERGSGNLNLNCKHIHKLLFLIDVGVQDDVREGIPRFVEMVEKINLITLLRDKMKEWNELKDIFNFIIDNLSKARRDLLGVKEEESSAMDVSSSPIENDKKRGEKMAAMRKAKLMAQMNQMQKRFALENARDLVEMDISNENDVDMEDTRDVEYKNCIAVGVNRGVPRTVDKMYTCILCQENQKLFSQSTGSADALIMASYIQKSSVLSGDLNTHKFTPSKCFQDYLPSDLSIGPAIVSCGHTMHAHCYQKFFSTLICKERERRIRRMINYDVSHNEYLCPICERLSNSVLPVVPPISTFIPLLKSSSENLHTWVKRMKNILSNKQFDNNDEQKEESESLSAAHSSLNDAILSLKLKCTSSEHSTPNMEMPLMPTPLNDMCNAFAMAVFIKSLGSDPHEGDHRVLQMLFQGLAYSIQLMDARSEMHLDISEREIETLRSLVRLCVSFPMTTSSPSSQRRPMHKFFRSNVILLFSFILEPNDKTHTYNKSFLDIDAIEMLIFIIVGYSSFIFGEEDNQYHLGAQDFNILHLIFLVHLSQIATSIASLPRESFEENEEDDDDHVAQQFIERFGNGHKLPQTRGAATFLKKKSLRFLRCATLFFHLYTDIPRGNSLYSYKELTRYMGLPGTLSELLHHSDRNEVLDNLVLAAKHRTNIISYPSQPRQLIKLPKNYSTLLNDVIHYKCPSSANGEWKLPVLCLICGAIVCQFSHCCESVLDGRTVGGCTSHARKCSADVGIFLNIGECLITLIVDGERGAFLSAPYVDEYGEYDDELRRGAPLFLDEEKYADLNKMWLNNSTSDKICRCYDQEVLTINSDWHTL